MAYRSAVGLIWAWGLWATGSTLDFLGAMPAWPFMLGGVGIAALIVISPLRTADRGARPAAATRV